MSPTEHKHMTRERTLLQLALYQCAQPVDATAQVRHFCCNPDVVFGGSVIIVAAIA